MSSRSFRALALIAAAGCQTAPPPPPPPPPVARDCVGDAGRDLGNPGAALKALMGCVKDKEVKAIEPLLAPAWIEAFNGHKQGLEVLILVLAARSATFVEDLDALRRAGIEASTVSAVLDAPKESVGALVIGRGVVVKNMDEEVTLLELVPASDARRVTEGRNRVVAKKTKTVPVRMGDEVAFLLRFQTTADEGDVPEVQGDLVAQVVFKKAVAR